MDDLSHTKKKKKSNQHEGRQIFESHEQPLGAKKPKVMSVSSPPLPAPRNYGTSIGY